MKLVEVYVGFYRPAIRNYEGKVDPRAWFGHCEFWGYTIDDTWLFFDPQGQGTRIIVTHHHDDVMDHLQARFALADSILRVPGSDPVFRIPIFGLLNCASICGHVVGLRALAPWTLHRKLLAKGAEVIHEKPEGKSSRQSGARA